MTRAEAKRYSRDPMQAKRDADRLLASRRRPRPALAHARPDRKAEKRQGREEKRVRRADVRALVVHRAEGRCEAVVVAPGKDLLRCSGFAAEWDHFWGRAREESVESTWMLCPKCHFQKTRNHPDRVSWLLSFRLHTTQYGYHAQGKKAVAALALEAAQHPEHAKETTP